MNQLETIEPRGFMNFDQAALPDLGKADVKRQIADGPSRSISRLEDEISTSLMQTETDSMTSQEK